MAQPESHDVSLRALLLFSLLIPSSTSSTLPYTPLSIAQGDAECLSHSRMSSRWLSNSISSVWHRREKGTPASTAIDGKQPQSTTPTRELTQNISPTSPTRGKPCSQLSARVLTDLTSVQTPRPSIPLRLRTAETHQERSAQAALKSSPTSSLPTRPSASSARAPPSPRTSPPSTRSALSTPP